jgi:hypothetical protein
VESFNTWWSALTPLNHWFFIAAAFFSVFLIWQLIMSLAGLGGGETVLDSHAEAAWEHHSPDDAAQTVVAFKLLSVRSILAFFTLFSWGGGLYMSRGVTVLPSLLYAVLWGVAAMLIVSGMMYMLRHLTDTGTMQVGSCLGRTAAVYLNIPAGGDGEVRVMCSGTMTHLKARMADGSAVKAGTNVKIAKITGPNSVEVQLVETASAGKDGMP